MEVLNQRALLQPYGPLRITLAIEFTDRKIEILILDGSKVINQNYDIQDEKYDTTGNIPIWYNSIRDTGNMFFFWYFVDCTGEKCSHVRNSTNFS